MGITRIEKIRNEEIKSRAGLANISEKITEARDRERKAMWREILKKIYSYENM